MSCICRAFTETPSGGLQAGGSCIESHDTITGGLSAGGSARVEIAGDVYDGFEAMYPLDEIGAGVTDEYEDLAGHELHGTGQQAPNYPERETGVYCLYCQNFNGDSLIRAPVDTMTNQPFSISHWSKIDDEWNAGVFLERGTSTRATRISYSIIRHLFFEVYHDDSSTITNSTTLQRDAFYHIAVEYDGSNITIYINGVQDGQLETTEDIVSPTEYNQFGKIGCYGTMQELRIYPEAKGINWFLTEWRNFCQAGFVEEGEYEVSPIYS